VVRTREGGVEDVGDALDLIVLQALGHRLFVREVQTHVDDLVALA
jgi:hypothetical protein